jgi:hypothetical protein
MKYLIFFESHSNIESLKSEILGLGIRKLAYDIIDASLDNLDEYENDEEGEILQKSLIFEVLIDNGYLESIIQCNFDLATKFTEANIIWVNEDINKLSEIITNLTLSHKILVLLSVIVGEEGNKKQVSCGDIIERLESMYPDIEFNTFDPWDIN